MISLNEWGRIYWEDAGIIQKSDGSVEGHRGVWRGQGSGPSDRTSSRDSATWRPRNWEWHSRLRNPNGDERPEHGSGGTGVNMSLMGSPMRQSEAALTPTAPPEPVVLGPNEQCGVPVAPSSEGKVCRQGLNAPLGVPQAFSTPLPNWDVKPEQTMLVNSDTRPRSLVHSDEIRDRSGSRVSQSYTDMSGQYAVSSGSPNQSVRQNKIASLAPDFHHSVQAHADFASGLGSSNMPQSNYRPHTMSQEQTGEESNRTALSRAAVPPNQMAPIRRETYGDQVPQINFIPAVAPTGRTKQKPEKNLRQLWLVRLFESFWNGVPMELLVWGGRTVQHSMSLTSAARQAWSDSFCDGRIPLTYDSLASLWHCGWFWVLSWRSSWYFVTTRRPTITGWSQSFWWGLLWVESLSNSLNFSGS